MEKIERILGLGKVENCVVAMFNAVPYMARGMTLRYERENVRTWETIQELNESMRKYSANLLSRGSFRIPAVW